MRPSRILSAVLFTAALGFLAGCSSDDSPTSPTVVRTQADADDMAVLAGISFDNLTTLFSANVGAAAGTPGFRAPKTVGFSTLSDTSFTRGSITYQVSRRWFDVNGVEQDAADATTDSLVLGTRASGTDSTTWAARYGVTLGHAGQLRIGGLVLVRPIVTIQGVSADTLDSRFSSLSGGVTRTFYARVASVASGIEIPKATVDSYPTTGTVRWIIHAQRTVNGNRGSIDRTLDATVTLTFNGTRYPTVTVNGTWHYLLDLETGAVSRGAA